MKALYELKFPKITHPWVVRQKENEMDTYSSLLVDLTVLLALPQGAIDEVSSLWSIVQQGIEVNFSVSLPEIAERYGTKVSELIIIYKHYAEEPQKGVTVFWNGRDNCYDTRPTDRLLPRGSKVVALFSTKGATYIDHYFDKSKEDELKTVLQQAFFMVWHWVHTANQLMKKGTIRF